MDVADVLRIVEIVIGAAVCIIIGDFLGSRVGRVKGSHSNGHYYSNRHCGLGCICGYCGSQRLAPQVNKS